MHDKNNKKKILYIITKSNWGGAQKYVYDLATYLSSKNITEKYDVSVLHGGNGRLNKKLKEAKIRCLRVNWLNRDINFLSEIGVFIKLVKIFRTEKPDIIHLNSSKIGGLGALAGRITNIKKIIFTAHGFAFNEDRSNFQKIIIGFLSYLTILLSHKTITISKKELRQITKWPFISKKVVLIYNGITKIDFLNRDEARKFLIEKNYTNLKAKNSPDTFSSSINDILWVGTISELTKNKGLKYAVKAISKLKKSLHHDWNGVFIIIGEGEDKNYLENLIQENGLNKNVFLAGFIDNAQRYLKAFDIFLLSSVKEGFPYALLEAGQAGNAVISTNVGGTGEIIDDMKSGILIRNKDKKEIMNALRFYMENKNKKNVFRQKLKEKIEKKFSADKMREQTLKIYLN